MSIFQSAISNWPEDEAYELLCHSHENGEPLTEAEIAQTEQRIFGREPDAQQLIARFRARLAKGLK